MLDEPSPRGGDQLAVAAFADPLSAFLDENAEALLPCRVGDRPDAFVIDVKLACGEKQLVAAGAHAFDRTLCDYQDERLAAGSALARLWGGGLWGARFGLIVGAGPLASIGARLLVGIGARLFVGIGARLLVGCRRASAGELRMFAEPRLAHVSDVALFALPIPASTGRAGGGTRCREQQFDHLLERCAVCQQ